VTMAVAGAVMMHRSDLGMLRGGFYPRSGMMHWPMMGFFGFFRALIPLGILVLAVFGVIYLARGGAKKTAQAPLPPAQPVVAPAPRVCAVCGKPLPAEGEFCPYCGAQQS
ncbi:MAG TPA: zinc ribbon domain-containing protein, partial [Anaerolineaceae bacterium]|nr:zinc ribbon domain-containing protein [Anaerolineaceae bacterium]